MQITANFVLGAVRDALLECKVGGSEVTNDRLSMTNDKGEFWYDDRKVILTVKVTMNGPSMPADLILSSKVMNTTEKEALHDAVMKLLGNRVEITLD